MFNHLYLGPYFHVWSWVCLLLFAVYDKINSTGKNYKIINLYLNNELSRLTLTNYGRMLFICSVIFYHICVK